MAFCKNCGAQMEDNVRFCANCGCAADGSVPTVKTARNTDHTAEFDAVDIAETKYLSLFCYLGVMFMILALVAKPHSAFVRYHANQGLVLMVLEFAATIVFIVPILGWIVGVVAAIFALVCVIIGIVNCCSGKAKELPLIGQIRIFK